MTTTALQRTQDAGTAMNQFFSTLLNRMTHEELPALSFGFALGSHYPSLIAQIAPENFKTIEPSLDRLLELTRFGAWYFGGLEDQGNGVPVGEYTLANKYLRAVVPVNGWGKLTAGVITPSGLRVSVWAPLSQDHYVELIERGLIAVPEVNA